MYGILIGCLILTVVYGEDIILKPGQVYTYSIRGYPNVKRGEAGHQVFNFRSAPGSQIMSFCTDFRMTRSERPACDMFELTFSDGSVEKKFCNSYDDVNFRSDGSQMTVEMKYSYGGLVSCVARSTEKTEPIKIVIQPGTTETIQDPQERTPYYDQSWEFTSSNNAQISLECFAGMVNESPCNRELLIIDDGTVRKEFCEDREPFEILSTQNKITVRGILNEYGNGRFRCFVSVKQEENKQNNHNHNEVDPPNRPLKTIHLKGTEEIPITIDGYTEKGEHKFEFISSPGSKVHIFCDEFYMEEPGCKGLEIVVDDGVRKETFCRESKWFNYFSKSSTVNMVLKNYMSHRIYCFARSDVSNDLANVELDVSDGIYTFVNPETPIPWMAKGWNFKTSPGTKLSLQCEISISSYENGDVCGHDFVSVNDGQTAHIYCGAKKIVLFSKGTTLQVRAYAPARGDLYYNCIVQTVTGPDPNEIKNLKVEDSAEDAGATPGRLGTTCQCGMRNNKQLKVQGRIFYGKETKEGEFPWMASIRSPGSGPRCGGSIITEYHVLTAAHCMVNSQTRIKAEIESNTVVYVGAYHRREDASHGKTKGYEVKETYIPEPWWQKKKRYDIAVLVMKERIVFSQFVSPVCMSRISAKLVNKAIRAIGWGAAENGGSPTYLLTTKLFVKSRVECGNQDEIICTINEKSSVCSGDSGGPLAYVDPDTNRYTQIGVASFVNYPYCESSSGFANVTYHFDYINDIVKRTMPSARICTKAN